MNHLKRALKLRDLILLNIVAVYTPSTLAQTMQLGRLGLLFWLVALLSFMLPYATAIADLARAHPREGGVYAWTRMAFRDLPFGDLHGFICGWCYWVNTFLYVPSIFLGLAAVVALLGGAQLTDNKNMVVAIACGSLLLSACLHIIGLGQGKWLQNFGAIGRLAIAACLLAAGLWRWRHPQMAATVSGETLNAWQAFALWPFVLNALVGLDLGSAMSEEADAPQSDIPRSLLTGGLAVGACYLLTYGAAIVLGANEANVIYGHVRAVQSVLPPGATSLAALLVLLELAGLLGSGAAWLAAPARVPFAIGLDHYLPAAFARVHPRFGTPYVALLAQASVAIVLIIVTTYQASLNDAYLVLLGGSIILVMVTYAYLFVAWWRLGTPTLRTKALSLLGLCATGLAVLACCIPPPSVQDFWRFEFNLFSSVALMLLAGLAVYLVAQSKLKARATP